MTTPKVLNALEQYYHQLNKSKRLRALSKSLRIFEPEDKVTLSLDGRRKELISRLTKEILNNLLTAAEQPKIVQEIKEELKKEFGSEFLFEFDPKEKTIKVRKEDKQEINDKEHEKIITKLKEIIYDKLNSNLSI